jgi:hypothetical protein
MVKIAVVPAVGAAASVGPARSFRVRQGQRGVEQDRLELQGVRVAAAQSAAAGIREAQRRELRLELMVVPARNSGPSTSSAHRGSNRQRLARGGRAFAFPLPSSTREIEETGRERDQRRVSRAEREKMKTSRERERKKK